MHFNVVSGRRPFFSAFSKYVVASRAERVLGSPKFGGLRDAVTAAFMLGGLVFMSYPTSIVAAYP